MPASRPEPVLHTGSIAPVRMIRTKIVATLGPAVAEPRTIRALLVAGVDVCRLNFSHGHLEDHEKMLRVVREQAAALEARSRSWAILVAPKSGSERWRRSA